MLQKLRIENFILIDKLELDFNDGFCVITGETGAGKSILLDAILFCLGKKIIGNIIRPQADFCRVSLTFTDDGKNDLYLKNNEINKADRLTIQSVLKSNGRKTFTVNGRPVTAKIVQDLFGELLEIHGQHNHTLLLNVQRHGEILDEFGGLEDLKNEVAKIYYKQRNLELEIATLDRDRERVMQEIDYLTHICAELEEAKIKPNEEQGLLEIKRKLQSYDKEKKLFIELIGEIENLAIERLINKIQRSASENPSILEKVSNDLDTAYDRIEAAKSSLTQMLREIDRPEFSSEEIEDRLYEIRTLARKHLCRPDELGEFLTKSQARLSFLNDSIKLGSDIRQTLAGYKQKYFELAEELSRKRIDAADKLSARVMGELSLLDMKKAIFKVEVNTQEEFASFKGKDKICFLASTNPGMSLSSIDQAASGGELARIMLALRVSLFDHAPKRTIIFDEIDVGISGLVADSIGDRLKILSKAVQILVITHQPQVAGKADLHILVEKEQREEYTIAKVRTLDAEGRTYELARMISGKKITKSALNAAKELII